MKPIDKQLSEYLAGRRKKFDIEIDFNRLPGTPFQKRVWKELTKIPYGTVISYKELARRVGRPRAFRAVGNANGKNPLPVIIPCHRVIKADGSLGGYSSGLHIKKKLLKLETCHPDGFRLGSK